MIDTRKTKKLIIKEGMFGGSVEKKVMMALAINHVDLLEIKSDSGFFSNTYTYKVYGDSIDILKAWNQLKFIDNLNVKLED